MTNQEIINYFGGRTVYNYSGSLQELQHLQETTYNSYNYLIVSDTIYFVATDPVADSKAQAITGV
jgi:hypothetical protein